MEDLLKLFKGIDRLIATSRVGDDTHQFCLVDPDCAGRNTTYQAEVYSSALVFATPNVLDTHTPIALVRRYDLTVAIFVLI